MKAASAQARPERHGLQVRPGAGRQVQGRNLKMQQAAAARGLVAELAADGAQADEELAADGAEGDASELPNNAGRTGSDVICRPSGSDGQTRSSESGSLGRAVLM